MIESLEPYWTIYFDMDGVLCNFNRHLCKTLKLREGAPNPHGRLDLEWAGTTQEAVDAFLDRTSAYWWTSMPPLSDAMALWHALRPSNRCVLTAPNSNPACAAGKMKWIQRYLGERTHTVLCREKWRLSLPGSILIDDTEEQVEKFARGQGAAMLWRGAGNTELLKL